MGRSVGPASGRFTPQAVERMLGQLEARAAQASDKTLTSAVVTGRSALAEWQDLAGRLRDLEGEYERLASCESRALARLQHVLDLLDKFVEPLRSAPAPIRSGYPASGGLIPAPRPSPGRDGAGLLAVRMLGAFELTIDGQRVTDWRGQRTQSLMQFLTAHRHRSVRRDELIEAVWPDVDEDNGRHRLHQAVYELRRILHAIDPDRSPILCADGGYEVDHEAPIWVDVEDFDDLASAASRCFAARRRDEAIELGQRALSLYRGDYLGQVSCADWATAERNRLRARFVQLSIHLGELLAGRGDHAAALAAVDPVLGMEPWNEEATVIMMRCHARSGARSMAAAAYRSCAAALTREFGITPAAQTSRVYDQIRSAEPPRHRGGLPRVGPEQDPDHLRPQRPAQLGHAGDAQLHLHRHGVIVGAGGRVPDQAHVDDLHRYQRSGRVGRFGRRLR
jgi:DNA-binding SARP family transcriptional activator